MVFAEGFLEEIDQQPNVEVVHVVVEVQIVEGKVQSTALFRKRQIDFLLLEKLLVDFPTVLTCSISCCTLLRFCKELSALSALSLLSFRELSSCVFSSRLPLDAPSS